MRKLCSVRSHRVLGAPRSPRAWRSDSSRQRPPGPSITMRTSVPSSRRTATPAMAGSAAVRPAAGPAAERAARRRLRPCHHTGQQRRQQADQAARERRWRTADAADRPAVGRRDRYSARMDRPGRRLQDRDQTRGSPGPCRSEGRGCHRRRSFARSRDTRNVDCRGSRDREIERCGGLDAAASRRRIRHARKPHAPPRQGRRRQREKSARLDAALLGAP